ncbi:MAG: hypothetical protein EP301_06610 [Gammaproteobacteria bacterium]|nr:MAG: hypothetical protein EP301_06610 [Gammaproteobacteria bacterium]
MLLIIGLLAAGHAAADRDHDRDRGGYHGKLGYSEVAGNWRKSARSYSSSRLTFLKTSNLNSGVCDVLEGSSRGLRMMCVAFCELQSCSPDFSAENPFESCSRSSKWIYNRYEKRRGAGDPEMPCVNRPEPTTQTAAACPCWTGDELSGFRYPASTDRVATCTVDNSPAASIQNFDNMQVSDGAGAYTLSLSSFGSYNGAPTCAMTDICADGVCLDDSRLQEVSAEELLACEADIAMAAANRGITCH